AEVAALYRVVEQAVDAVAVVAVILGGVDAALRGDGVRAPRAVVKGKAADVVTLLCQRSRGGRARKSRADDDDAVLAPVGGIDQLHFKFTLLPLAFDRAGRNPCVEHHSPSQRTQPSITASGTEMNPRLTTAAIRRESVRRPEWFRVVPQPSVCKPLQMP